MPPWNTDDMRQKDSHIKTPKDARQARDVANQVLKETGDEGRALREAFGVIRKGQAGVGGVQKTVEVEDKQMPSSV
jgi:hypothetical protein